MGYTNPDVYNQPEAFGLTIVGTVDIGDGYDYDMFVVWKDKKGKLYYGTSAGCSCNAPFEDDTSLDSLTRGTRKQVLQALSNWQNAEWRRCKPNVSSLQEKLAQL